MALGCAFIFLVVLMWWRRRARKQRAKRTAMFAKAKNLHDKGWRGRLVRFGEKFFGHSAKGRAAVLPVHRDLDMKLQNLREAEDARHEREVESFIDAYDYSGKPESRSSRVPSSARNPNGLSGHSLYSEVTGKPRQSAEPRQPVKKDLLGSRFSSSTLSSSYSYRTRDRDRVVLAPTPPVPTEAEAYVMAVRPALNGNPGSYWMEPNNTRNPFRQ